MSLLMLPIEVIELFPEFILTPANLGLASKLLTPIINRALYKSPTLNRSRNVVLFSRTCIESNDLHLLVRSIAIGKECVFNVPGNFKCSNSATS